MNIISKRTILNFCKKHLDSEQAFLVWFNSFESIKWEGFNHLKAYYPAVDNVGNNRYVFNIKGNKYRLVVKINFCPF